MPCVAEVAEPPFAEIDGRLEQMQRRLERYPLPELRIRPCRVVTQRSHTLRRRMREFCTSRIRGGGRATSPVYPSALGMTQTPKLASRLEGESRTGSDLEVKVLWRP